MPPRDELALRVTQPSYDLTGADRHRVIKHFFISKMAPREENFAGGPGWKCLLLLSFLHGLGVIAGWGLYLFGPQAKTLIGHIQRRRPR